MVSRPAIRERRDRDDLCVADDGARLRVPDRSHRHRRRITVGGEGRFDHVAIADAHGVRHESTPTFYDRFRGAFLREDTEFVQTVLEDRLTPLTLRDATEATRIAMAMMQSLRERCVVTL